MSLTAIQIFLMTRGMDLALKVLAAVALWIVGRWAIKFISRLITRSLKHSSKIDATLARYLCSISNVLLTGLLLLAVLQLFGVQTTSFAALLAGIGLAIGTAWGGLLTHFAAGVFMQVLRPFKVGDTITAGGVTGTVKELGLFGTTILTADNIVTLVPNNKIFSDNIANYSAMPQRRVDLTAQIPNNVNVDDAISRLKEVIAKISNVVNIPAPAIGVLSITPAGPLLFVRPTAIQEHYAQVHHDAQCAILKVVQNLPLLVAEPVAQAAPPAAPIL